MLVEDLIAECKNVLVVTGNGFDLAHGLSTDYGSLRAFLLNQSDETARIQMVHLVTAVDDVAGTEWKSINLENELEKIDFRRLVDSFFNQECIEYPRTEQQYEEVKAIICGVGGTFKRLFEKWILGVNETLESKKPLPQVEQLVKHGASFLTFNFTNTVRSLYGQSVSKVKYVHGQAGKNGVQIGHAIAPLHDIFSHDDRDALSGNYLEFFADTIHDGLSKQPKANTKHRSDIWNFVRWGNFDAVIIFGWAINDEDTQYLVDLLNNLNQAKTSLFLEEHLSDQMEELNHKVNNLAVLNKIPNFQFEDTIVLQ